LLAELGDDPVGPPFDVREVALIESETRRAGAVYTPRATFPLA
jgi:hypothetical protein